MNVILSSREQRRQSKTIIAFLLLAIFSLYSCFYPTPHVSRAPKNAEIFEKCRNLHAKPAPQAGFGKRSTSDRFQPGTKATLIRNATIWTGRVDGFEIVQGDLLLEGGIIKDVGLVDSAAMHALDVVDAGGAWVTPGIIDMHSHMGVFSSPALSGANDGNSFNGVVQPWLRSLDGLNTHDESYRLAVAGGTTTALILPGSANAIGGQAFAIKTRPTAEKSPSSMVIELPFHYNGSAYDPPRWRQMKYACGENPARIYDGTRMDTIWALRQAYDHARTIKNQQDAYCSKALEGSDGSELGDFPEELQWEALVDVLRGKVKIQNHCYEAVDIDGMVRLSNEFQFEIAAFHHAHETYLVTDLIKKAYGKTPAVAMFATIGGYKREAYRISQYAPRIIADAGLDVVMKTDHPLISSGYLLHEAQQAHYYGLPAHIALASVTSTPARIMGYDHRIGYLAPGYDADLVIWDAHPLSLGASPKQVLIDGIAQLHEPPLARSKPESSQRPPVPPNFDDEREKTMEYDGLPPLGPSASIGGVVVFANVGKVFTVDAGKVVEILKESSDNVVVVNAGKLICYGPRLVCLQDDHITRSPVVDLEGGVISPGLLTVGTDMGLQDIELEITTADGHVFDALQQDPPSILGNETLIRSVDGLQFHSRFIQHAYRAGVTVGVVAPSSPWGGGFIAGLSTAYSTGAKHKLEKGSVVQREVAVHVTMSMGSSPSISTKIAALRRLLKGTGGGGDLASQFRKIVNGEMPLVVSVHNADVMASLIWLKTEIERETGVSMRMTFLGARESHLIAAELALAGVGVVLGSVRPFPGEWQSRRILHGPPLEEDTLLGVLLAHNITVGIGSDPIPSGPQQSTARNVGLEAAWAAMMTKVPVSDAEMLALASVNLAKLLGLGEGEDGWDLVATKAGAPWGFEGKVVGISSPRRRVTDLF